MKIIKYLLRKLNQFRNWFELLFYFECKKCKTKSVYFSHEEHFTPGSPNIYICKNCGEQYIVG